MDNSTILEKNSKENYVRNLNASNEAERLKQQINALNNGMKNINNNKNNISNTINNAKNNNTASRIKGQNNKPNNTLNKAASDGLQAGGVPKPVSDAIVNSKLGQNLINKAKKKNPALNMISNLFGGKKEEEKEEPEIMQAVFTAPVKVIKWSLIAMGPISTIIIFCCLFVCASQIYLNSIGIGNADNVSDSHAEDTINNVKDGKLDNEIKDKTAYIEINTEKSLKFKNSKLQSNLVTTAKRRPYNEAELEELKDFYPEIVDQSKNYDENMVYDFYFKMSDLYKTYLKEYGGEIDLPLLMATLRIQSSDMYEIFSSNLSKEDTERHKEKDANKRDMSNFKFDVDWSSYIPATTSEHDMEVLAKNMFTGYVIETCTDSKGKITKENRLEDDEIGTVTLECGEDEIYKVTDIKLLKNEEKYMEFLKQFIEKKYYLDKNLPLNVKIFTGTSETYEFVDPDNELRVLNMITEIYDAKEQYVDLAGDYEETLDIKYATSNMYWWPIGSNETSEINGVLYAGGEPPASVITSTFYGNESFRSQPHYAIDIAVSGSGIGNINVIASKSGEVVYPTSKDQINFEDKGGLDNEDGGRLGNYVKIRHADGTYTLYGHLSKGTITVMAGDVVEQGQVIGKLGNSGRSTGPHLHFAVLDVNGTKVDPEQFVDINNPRPTSMSSDSFSLTTTSLSKAEFIAKMQDYYDRTNDENFRKNFLSKVEEIYEASIKYNINPELVVVTAKSESSFKPCGYTGNYWGIGITNGEGCNAGPTFSSMSDGIAGYAKTLAAYTEYGNLASMVTSRYNERKDAGCDDAGHGLPGTLAGMQSVYSWVGDYRYNPGSSGLGGCHIFKNMYNDASYCSTHPSCTDYNNCSEETRTTVCEQNDYTAFQIKQKIQYRYDIFGL